MIRIFNKKQAFEILIDETIPQVIFTPRDYEDIPYVKIELKGFNFHHHTYSCSDCKAFLNSFGTSTLDWFIEYSGKIKRLDLSEFSESFTTNRSIFRISEFENGSILKLNLSNIPTTISELEKRLEKDLANENYEKCCIWRDLISELQN
jgi:hypothetical protein